MIYSIEFCDSNKQRSRIENVGNYITRKKESEFILISVSSVFLPRHRHCERKEKEKRQKCVTIITIITITITTTTTLTQ